MCHEHSEWHKDRLTYSVTVRILASKVLSVKYLNIELGLNQRIKFVCVAMYSLVMSLCSLDEITIHGMAVN